MKNTVGKCPECGGEVIEFSGFYGCGNWRPLDGSCGFTMPKTFAGRGIPPFIAEELVKYRSSRILDGFVSRKGERFSASLELQRGQRWRLKMRFE